MTDSPGLRGILAQHGREYIAQYGDTLPSAHRKLIPVMRDCGTGALGHVAWNCGSCGGRHVTPRSCGNRHCPGCGQAKAARWEQAQNERLLPCAHFLVTLTVPSELRPLIRRYQRVCYPALFRASAAALKKLCRNDKYMGDAKIGFTSVLHTWGRDLNYHPHIHILIPAGGVIKDGEGNLSWKNSRIDFLVPVKALSKLFRGKLKSAILAAAGEEDHADLREELAVLGDDVWRREFVTDIEAVGEGRSTVTYLSRYVSRAAISNSRIKSLDHGEVTYSYTPSGTRKRRLRTVSAFEFLRLFLQHILPKGQARIRHCGVLSGSSSLSRNELLRLVEASLPETERPPKLKWPGSSEREFVCPKCGGPLLFREILWPQPEYLDSS